MVVGSGKTILAGMKDGNKQLWSKYKAQDSESTQNDEQWDGSVLDLWSRFGRKVSWYEPQPHNEERKGAERYVLCFIEIFREFEAEYSKNSGNSNNAGLVE